MTKPNKKPKRSSAGESSAPPWGGPGSVNDERRCTAKANRTGERCRAPAIKGANVCRVHGGATPQVKRTAKERLLELVDPALAALHKTLTDPKSDDHVKVRAALGILDRTGFQRGVQISVETRAWDEAVTESIDLDRTGIEPGYGKAGVIGGGGGDDDAMELEQKAYAAYKLAEDARSEAWAETDWDADDAPPDHPYRDEHTVQGEVLGESIIPTPADDGRPTDYGGDYRHNPEPRERTDPPRYERDGERIPDGYYIDEEIRRASGNRPRRNR